MSSALKTFAEFLWEVTKIVILALAIVFPIRIFLFQPFVIQGQSMEPNFHEADYLIVNELSYRLRAPERGEVVVFFYPLDTTKRFIKRIIGLPGETVEIANGKVTIMGTDGKTVVLDETYIPADLRAPDMPASKLGENEYFVLGDNRPSSSDSQDWGVLPKKDIIGKVEFRLWPISDLSKIETPTYAY
ncbi:MAG: signal peptidase I [Candidatus Pacebacteria bacterium]|jgi:signal peptidase I|nr:signal peptidase I [Candidatus Paceibacterota bacterium]